MAIWRADKPYMACGRGGGRRPREFRGPLNRLHGLSVFFFVFFSAQMDVMSGPAKGAFFFEIH